MKHTMTCPYCRRPVTCTADRKFGLIVDRHGSKMTKRRGRYVGQCPVSFWSLWGLESMKAAFEAFGSLAS